MRLLLPRLYDEHDATIYGARRICWKIGHDLESNTDRGWAGGIQMQYDRRPGESQASCDQIKCKRCDAKFTVEYPEIGCVVTPVK